MSTPHWVEEPENTDEYFLAIHDPEGWWRAGIRWDGCVNLDCFRNIPFHADPKRESHQCCDDYIHICDVDDLIARLQSLKEMAQEYFDGTIHQQHWETKPCE